MRNQKTTTIFKIIFLVYMAFIIFSMFFAFNRGESITAGFSLTVYHIPLWIPQEITRNWIFSLGNLLAFAPFGVLLPVAFPTIFKRYWSVFLTFVIGITFLEYMQMATVRGTFDVEDILVNTLGLTIGYISWRISRKVRGTVGKVSLFIVLLGLMTVLCIVGAEFVNAKFFA